MIKLYDEDSYIFEFTSKVISCQEENGEYKVLLDKTFEGNTLEELLDIFKQKDNNNLFEINGSIYKMEYPLKENNVQKSAQKIKNVYDNYLKDMNVYYSIIPDKNYYLENDDHLKIDYNKLQNIVETELQGLKYIDITKGLKLEDYLKYLGQTMEELRASRKEDAAKSVKTRLVLEATLFKTID